MFCACQYFCLGRQDKDWSFEIQSKNFVSKSSTLGQNIFFLLIQVVKVRILTFQKYMYTCMIYAPSVSPLWPCNETFAICMSPCLAFPSLTNTLQALTLTFFCTGPVGPVRQRCYWPGQVSTGPENAYDMNVERRAVTKGVRGTLDFLHS